VGADLTDSAGRRAARLLVLLVAALSVATGCTPASRRMDRVLDLAMEPAGGRFRLVYAPVDGDVADSVRNAVREGIAAASRWGTFVAPVTVRIYPDHDALIDAIGSQDYPWLRAWARYDEILLQSPRTWGIDYTDQLPELLRHELTHVAMYQRVATASDWEDLEIPLWFREGMASWTAQQGYRRGRPDQIGAFLRDHGDVDPFQPDADLLHAQKDLVYNTSHWAFDHLVRSGGEEQVTELMDILRSGTSFQAAFQRVFGMSEGAFRQRWRRLVTGEPGPADLRQGPVLQDPPGSSGDTVCPGVVRLRPAAVAAGERLIVEVEAEGAGVTRPEPARGALDGVEVGSQRASTTIRVVSGEVVARHTVRLEVRAPRRPGPVRIGPFVVRVEGRPCELPAVTLQVGEGSRPPHGGAGAPPPSPPPRRRARPGPTISLVTTGEPVPPGESARVAYVFPPAVHRVRLSRPDVPGVWLEEERDDRLRWTLDPIFFGEVRAGPLAALAWTGGGLFATPRRVELESPPLRLRFEPPPAPPAGLHELLAATAREGGPQDRTAVLLLDLSSSLRVADVGSRSRLRAVGEAVVALSKALPARHRVGLVLYREGAFTYLAPTQAPERLVEALGRLRWDDLPEEGSGTGVAVLQAIRHLQPLAGRRHVLALSDGDCGPVGVSCSTAGRIARGFGIPVSALVVGAAVDASPLEALARATGGRLARLAGPRDLEPAVAAVAEALGAPTPAPDLASLRPSNLPLVWRRLEEMDRRLRIEYFARGRPAETL